MSDKKPERRDFLFTASYAVGVVGVAAVVWPLVDQMNPDASVKALASTEVDVSSVQPGNTSTVSFDGFLISIPTGLLFPGTCNAQI